MPRLALPPKKKKSARTTTAPETAEEYLTIGVDCEEGGEKWRAGDAQKSFRFFLRAIANYDEGLKSFPQDFNLAYNQ